MSPAEVSTAKCPQCGFHNRPQETSCTFCRAGLAVVPAAPSGQRLLLLPGAPAIELEPTKACSFGRLPTCTVMINAPTVSRLHAEITWRDGRPVLTDRSSYGTLVGGLPVKEHALASGDEIAIGPFHCTYFEETSDGGSTVPLEEMKQATLPGSGAMLVGLIPEAGLSEYLQALEFNAKTGTLHVFGFGKGKTAWLALSCGAPIAAEADGRVGEEAVLAILGLKQGRFLFSRKMTVTGRSIPKSITALLFEAGRRADEASRHAP